MTIVPDPLPGPELRISFSDRERVGAILQNVTSEGQLTLQELDDRLAAVNAAKTHSELAHLTADLVPAHQQRRVYTGTVQAAADRKAFAMFGAFQRTGKWRVGRLFKCLALLGGGVIDLREAEFVEGDTEIRIKAVMGGVQVYVAPDAEVHVNGSAVLGAFDQSASGAGAPGAPVIVVSGLAFWGSVQVIREPLGADRR